MKGLCKKILTLVLSIAIVGLYTFGSTGPVFAAGETSPNITTAKTAEWQDPDKGIAKVTLTVNAASTQVINTKVTRIVLVLDRSNSMRGNKLSSLKTAAKSFVNKVLAAANADVKVAVVSYSSQASTDITFSSSESDLDTAIDSISTSSGTNIQAGILAAETLMSAVTGADNKFIVVLSDGQPTRSYKGTAAVAADTSYNYNSSLWPYRITASSTDLYPSANGSYDYSFAGYDIGTSEKYTAVVYDADSMSAADYYYKDGDSYYAIKYHTAAPGDNSDSSYYYYTKENNDIEVTLTSGTTVIYSRSTSSMKITNHGFAAVSEAYNAKAAGSTLYSIGFDITDDTIAKSIMSCIASSSENYFNTSSNLTSVFDTIAGSIQDVAAGTGAVVTDPLGVSTTTGSEFKFKAITDDSTNYPITVTAPNGMTNAAATYDTTNDTFTWNLGDGNLKAGKYTLTYYVKLNLSDLKGAKGKDLSSVLTNNGAVLNYANSAGTAKSATFTDPSLPVTHYTVEYYYKDSPTVDYAKGTATDTAVAIAGCSDISASTSMINAGKKSGYDYDSASYGTGTNKNTTALKVLANDQKDQNVIKLYYHKYLATGSVTFAAKKNYNRTLQAGDFAFVVQKCTADGTVLTGNAAETYSGSNAASGNIAITGATFDQDDIGNTEYYLITEDTSHQRTGITYSTDKYLAKVVVADSARHDGSLNITVTYYKQGSTGAFTEAVNVPEFNNTYAPVSAVFNLSATKTYTKTLKGGDFYFTATEVEDANGTEMTGDDVYTSTASNDSSGNISFSAITYASPGTHYYRISEVQGTNNGVGYDTNVYIVKVTVSDNGEGSLAAAQNTIPAFENSYQASGSLTITGKKVLEGRELNSGDIFTFVVKEGNKVITNGTNNVGNHGPSVIVFNEIDYTYDDVGEHNYTITETKRTDDGITTSTAEIPYKVTVSDNGNGTLAVSTAGNDEVTFTNTYTPTTAKVDLKATKTYNRELKGEDFTFNATEVADAQGTALTGTDVYTKTVKNDKEGKVDFGEIIYTAAGTHYYKITEVQGSKGGVSYDSHSYIVTVTVSDDLKGKLSATADQTPEFRNTYSASSVEINLLASKKYNRALRGGEFSFVAVEMTDIGEAVEPEVTRSVKAVLYVPFTAKAVNDANGSVDFGKIKYTQEGTHYYLLREVVGSDANITYDTNEKIVTVVVSDDGNGKLTANVDSVPVFTNTYTEPYVPPVPPAQVSYVVNYYEKGTTTVIAPQESSTGTAGTTVDYSSLETNGLIKAITDYKYDSVSPENIVLAAGTTVQYINVYYTSTKTEPQNPKDSGGTATTNTGSPQSDKSADTGDNWNAGLWMLLILLGAGGTFISALSRRKEDR